MTDYDQLAASLPDNEPQPSAAPVLYAVADTDPEAEASLRRLSKSTGLPVESLRLKPVAEEARRTETVNRYDRILRDNPKTAGFLQDPVAAAVSHDDVEGLSFVERTLRGLGGGFQEGVGMAVSGTGVLADIAQRRFVGGLSALFLPEARQGQGKPTTESLAGPLIGEGWRQTGGMTKEFARERTMVPAASQTFYDKVLGGIGQVGAQVATLPITRGAGLYAQGADAMDEKLKNDNPTAGQYDAAVLAGAAVTGITEKWALDKLLGPLDTGIKNATLAALARIGIASASEGVQEFSENMLQDVIREVVVNDALNKPVGYLGDSLNVGQSLEEGGVGAAVGGVIRSMVEAGLHIRARGSAADKAEASAQFIEQVNQAATASKVLARDPETFQQFVKAAAEDGPVTDVYIDAQALNQSGLADQVLAASPAAAEQYEEALATGGQIRIPVDEYAARIAPQAYAQQLLDDLRLQPEDMTRREAKEYAQSGAMQELEQAMSRIIGDKAKDDTFTASRDRVKQAVLDNLNTLGRFTPQKNELDATLIAARSATRAAQLGVAPEEFFNKYLLKVVAQGQAGEQALNQGDAADGIDIWRLLADADNAGGKQAAKEKAIGLINEYPYLADAVRENYSDLGYSYADLGGQENAPERTTNDSNGDADSNNPPSGPDYFYADSNDVADQIRWFLDNDEDWSDFGLRVIPDGYEVKTGDVLPVSKRWDDGTDTGEELRGTSTIGVDDKNINQAMRLISRNWSYGGGYMGSQVVLVRGSRSGPGEDDGESLIERAEVVYSWKKPGRFFQQQNQKARGWFNPATNTIALLKNADLSTFLHESGHYFLETDIAVARELLRDNAAFGPETMKPGEQQILRDVSALLKWFGIEGDIASQIDQWDRMDFEERRAYHEKTAESFERYLLEGKAPSIELQSVFQTFRQWLVSIYKSIKDFIKRNPDAGELSDEVRAVFDRMLATEEEIKLAEQARGMLPLFADAMNAGMTPAEFAEYQKLGNEATQAAIDQLQAQGIRDMKWLSNARSRMLKKLQKQAKAQRAEMRAAARADVMREPVYQAWNLLTSKMTDEDKLAGKKKRSEAVDPAVDSLFEAIAKLGGLSRETLAAQWGVDPKDKAESGLFGKPVMRAKDGGRSLDWMVEALTEEGYLTPDENGKGDVLELKERFKAELRGDRQYSSIRNWEPEPLPGEGQDLGGITAARIDRASLDGMEDLPQEVIDRLESLGMTARTGGIHPDVLSEILPGWTSGDELVRALASAVPLKEAIEARTDQWMLEQYSDMATPEAIERAADMAIHNDARERFLLAEHKALAKASGDKSQRQVMLTAAKDYARQLIGRQRIRDVRPGQYAAAEARAAKAAATGKDVAQKAAEKRNQLLSAMAARESYRAQEDVAKGLRYLKKFDSPTIRKRVNGDYVDQIEALLEKVDLRKRSLTDIDRRKSFGAFVRSQIEKGVVPAMSDSLLPPGLRAAYQAKVMERDENGELIVRDDVEQAKVLADYLDMAEARSYKDMTVEGFRGLVETIRQIEHLGRKKKSLLTARDGKTYEQKRDELVSSVTANSERLPDRMNRTIPNDRAEKLRGLRDFRISLRKIGMIMRLLDGNKDGGPMWDFFARSANERGDWETEQIASASEVLTKALRPVFTLKGGMRGKGIHFESIGRSLNREQRIGLALNVGNEGNLQRLLDGEGWTYADIQPVLESLTAAEWQAVQEVWDHMDSYRPLIAAIERRTVGGEPEWVQPMQFTVNTKDGQTLTLKGGYYPVKYDAEASQRAEELEDATDAKRAMNAATNTSTTHRSFVKKRSEAVVGRPLELSLSAMYSGVQDVIHDLAWREWLIDASKMISSSALDDAIRRKYGAETPRAIRQWISDIAAGTRKPRGVFDRAAAFLRKNVAASGLAVNVMNAVLNFTGLQNSADRIGAKWLAVGQGEYLSGPKDAAAWVHEKSSFMEHRARTQFRDLNELRNVVENGDSLLTKAKNNQFILITMTQKMVDMPTWIGAYRKAEAEGAVVQLEDGSIDDSKAVAMADQAVIDAQGSGMIKDLAGIERGGELAKLFTTFYSYMNTTYNLAANRVSGARGGSLRERGSASFLALMIVVVPAMLEVILKAGLTPGDDDDFDDPEKLAKKLAMEQVSFAMGLIPMAREFTPMIQPFLQDQTFGYQGPAGLRIIGDATKFTQQAAQGEFDDGFRKAAVGLSGSLFGLPAAQINRTWTGVEALADDKTDNPGALMFGYQE